ADVGGDDAGPGNAVLGEGFVVLAQGDDQAQHKGKDGAEGEGRSAVGQLVQDVALCFASFAEAVLADGNAQPGHKTAHARQVQQPDIDRLRAEDVGQKAQRGDHGGGDQGHDGYTAGIDAGKQPGGHALLGQRVQHAGGGI